MTNPLTKKLQELIKKYLDGNASEDEIKTIEDYYYHFNSESEVTEQFTEPEIDVLNDYLRSRISAKIERLEKPVIPFYRNGYFKAAAALLVFLLSFLLYHNAYQSRSFVNQINKPVNIHDLVPGNNKAILTLANGSKLILNDIKNGDVSNQEGVRVVKSDDELSYKANTSKINSVEYNTITIPNGGQHQLVLADGTKVWLNAASSLRYPTAFIGQVRTVELTGEAYFEVAKDQAKPFNVKTASQTVQVLGTHFNINAYSNEPDVKTTLLEGSVKVSSAKGSVLIKPGQQSLLTNNGSFELKSNLDIDEIMAWKDGVFQFNNADIQTIMRQIARWYDIEVEFKGQIPTNTYHGKISRNSNASQVLKILELSGINFTIEGRKIIVK